MTGGPDWSGRSQRSLYTQRSWLWSPVLDVNTEGFCGVNPSYQNKRRSSYARVLPFRVLMKGRNYRPNSLSHTHTSYAEGPNAVQ